MNILILDNHDSFTFNLAHQIAVVSGYRPHVFKNDAIDYAAIERLDPDLIVISPGPGRPEVAADMGVCRQVLEQWAGPILGVCLGFQGLAHRWGGVVTHAFEPMHGRISAISHVGRDLFQGLAMPLEVVRYHSLMVQRPLPDCLDILAETADGTVMAMRHKTLPQWGIQFHPESICTQSGHDLIANLLTMLGLRSRPLPESLKRPALPAKLGLATRLLETSLDEAAIFERLYGDRDVCFWLDSSRLGEFGGQFSFMGDASGPLGEVIQFDQVAMRLQIRRGDRLEVREQTVLDYLQSHPYFGQTLPRHSSPFRGGFVGFFGYEMATEHTPPLRHRATTPDAAWMFCGRFLVFDHEHQKLWACALFDTDSTAAECWFDQVQQTLNAKIDSGNTVSQVPVIRELKQSQSDDAYQKDIDACLQSIRDGESYEICLTNRLHLDGIDDPFAAYLRLRAMNRAPYGAFMRFYKIHILSSSPEQFLKVDEDGWVQSKPIKGTAARHEDAEIDRQQGQQLQACMKSRSENLMIVDLLRHDLGRVCELGSVTVPVLIGLESYATVHQLVSTIRGRLLADKTIWDVIHAAFPGGSMTGAPKRRTMALIDGLEQEARGIYSGCLGYIGLNGVSELSIVIRTAVIEGSRATIGTGGAITALSAPADELGETWLKASAILKALGYDV